MEDNVQTSEPTVSVIKTGHKHKTRKSSSKATRRLTDLDRRVSKALRRFTKALDSGVEGYNDHRDRSKAKRKDGPIVDFVVNVSYGVSRAVSEASPLLVDFAEALNARNVRTQVRRVGRTFSGIPFLS